MHRNRSVNVHDMTMIPRSEIPRSGFRMQKALKTTFNSGILVPMFVEEALPGDHWRLNGTFFARMATPIVALMDNLHFETFYFFVPNRLVWTNWVKFMGQQDNPADSISYTIPQTVSPVGGYTALEMQDYMGLPTFGQVGAAATFTHSALPTRGYNLIYNEWFRDENLIPTRAVVNTGDGPDLYTDYNLRRRGKRKDYFTGALPWTQKGTSVPLPLGSQATVKTSSTDLFTGTGLDVLRMRQSSTGGFPAANSTMGVASTGGVNTITNSPTLAQGLYPTNLYADLSTATAATINQIRQAFQIQRFLERDARGGTRYVELLQSHFGVHPQDFRLQRPEYLGGGYSPVSVNPVSQSSATGLTGATTPIGTQSAFASVLGTNHGFSYAVQEHGYIIGIMNVRADLTYQQGLRRHWSRSTRYDYYDPAFAHLGEQSILNKEIYLKGDANDALTFGYQERWAEMRYLPSEITGLFRSTYSAPLDIWHLAQKFTALPTLGQTFIEDSPPVQRVVAALTGANGQEFLCDAFFDAKVVRPLPMYSVPGLVDHF